MSGDAAARSPGVERTMLRGFTAIRLGLAGLGLVTVARERGRYVRPVLAVATAAFTFADVARTSRLDATSSGNARPSTVKPAMVGLAACVGMGCSAGPDTQFGDLVDWAYHLLLWSSALIGLSDADQSASGAVTGISMVTYVGLVRVRAGQGSLPRAMANALPIGGFFIAARLLATNLRSTDREIGIVNDKALRARTATEIERVRGAAIEDLYGGALTSLNRIEELWSPDRRQARRVAATEALRLRQKVHGGRNTDHDLRSRLEACTLALLRQGVEVDLSVDVVVPVDPEITESVVSAVESALLALSGSDDQRCVARVVCDELAVVVRIRDHTTELDGSDLLRSLEDTLASVDGQAEVWSSAGRGTRIVMRVGTGARSH